jgi:hypothetical protein
MSALTLFGIVVLVVTAISVAIVVAMFVWAAREDGRDQRRTDARVRRLRGSR